MGCLLVILIGLAIVFVPMLVLTTASAHPLYADLIEPVAWVSVGLYLLRSVGRGRKQ